MIAHAPYGTLDTTTEIFTHSLTYNDYNTKIWDIVDILCRINDYYCNQIKVHQRNCGG